MQKAFHLELERCTGCNACQIACQIENDLEPGTRWRRVLPFNELHVPGVPQFFLSLACNHCVDAPCEKNCPALAYDKDPQTGAVTIDRDRCIGCKYCSWACPYDAPQFNGSTGVMEKCTFCSHRLNDGLEPACTTSCPTGALRFGNYEPKPDPAPVPGFYRENIEPAISLRPLMQPAAVESVDTAGFSEAAAEVSKKVSLRSEWSLLVFTFVAPALVAMGAAGWTTSPIVAIAGVVAMGVSAAHLGKPGRAYRAMLNWKRSWLSREVILFSAFVGLSFLPSMRWPATLVGLAALYAMDQVCRLPTNRRRREMSSSSVFLTGVYLTALFSELRWVFIPIAALKLVLYLRRRVPTWPTRASLFGARVFLGFVLPAVVLVTHGSVPFAIASVLVGELLDRIEFYLELDFVQPAEEMRIELERAVREGFWS